MKRSYPIILGLALLTASIVGFLFQDKRYYYIEFPKKIEITKLMYESKIGDSSKRAHMMVINKVNIPLVLLSLMFALGIGQVMEVVFNNSKDGTIRPIFKSGSTSLFFASLFFKRLVHLQFKINKDLAEQFIQNGRSNGDLSVKINYFNKAISADPYLFQAYSYRGYVKNLCNSYDEAICDYDKAILLNPRKNWFDYHERGFAKQKTLNFQGALIDYNEAITLSPMNAYSYEKRGEVKLILRNYADAIDDFSVSIKLSPTFLSYYKRGVAYFENKDYLSAITDFDEAIAMKNNHADSYYFRGNAKLSISDKQNGYNDLKKARELGCMRTPKVKVD